MRTKTTTVYLFDELSDNAKSVAVNEYINRGYEYPFADENSATLDMFCKTFNVSCRDYEYGYRNYINGYLGNIEDNVLALSGVRAATYFINNYSNVLFKPAYIRQLSVKDKAVRHFRVRVRASMNGTFSNVYTSGVKVDTDCNLTGYCMDMDILEPIYKHIARPCPSTTIEDILNSCLQSWLLACKNDYEGSMSFEAISDTLIANDYEFTEDGKFA